jgi:hypothetical protein
MWQLLYRCLDRPLRRRRRPPLEVVAVKRVAAPLLVRRILAETGADLAEIVAIPIKYGKRYKVSGTISVLIIIIFSVYPKVRR